MCVQAFGNDYVDLDHQKAGNTLYLHLLWKRVSSLQQQAAACDP